MPLFNDIQRIDFTKTIKMCSKSVPMLVPPIPVLILAITEHLVYVVVIM